SNVASPSGPSKAYSLSIFTIGRRRRSAANASRARVASFSFARIRSRAASHSSGDTTWGRFMVFILASLSTSLSTLDEARRPARRRSRVRPDARAAPCALALPDDEVAVAVGVVGAHLGRRQEDPQLRPEPHVRGERVRPWSGRRERR